MAGEREIARFPLTARVDRDSNLLVQTGPTGTPMFRATPVQLFGALAATDVVQALGYTPLASSQVWAAGGVTTLGTDLLITGTQLQISVTLSQDYSFTGSPSAPNLPTSPSGLAAGKWWNNGGVLCIA